MKRIFIINLVFFLILFFLSEVIIFFVYKKSSDIAIFKYDLGQYKTNYNFDNYFSGKSNEGSNGRTPDGLEYKSSPIILFGCSFTYGQYLEKTETFSYKLAHYLKVPVYNRGRAGSGLQHMLYQSSLPEFYKEIKNPSKIIYLFLNDHYRRMYGLPFSIYDDGRFLHYKKNKNNELIKVNDNIFINNLVKSFYTYRYIKAKYIDYEINNAKNAEKLTDIVLAHFIETRKNLEKNYNKSLDFYVIFYDDSILYNKLLKKKLEDNNFKVILLYEFTDIDYYNNLNPIYIMQDNGHPTGKTWDLLVPIIAKEITK